MTTIPVDVPAVPIVTIISNGDAIKIHRPAAGHTFTFNVSGLDSLTLAACLRGALADAYLAGAEGVPR